MLSKFANNIGYFFLILILCSGIIFKNGLSEKLAPPTNVPYEKIYRFHNSESFVPKIVQPNRADICNDDACMHGKCEVLAKIFRCRCDEGYTGLRCEDRIQTKSDKQLLWQMIQTLIMLFMLIFVSGIFYLLLRRKK
ncbi:proepiregulin-like [Argiope bruennichi]|uniref:proepiregulin-like n=1 Tax=Argiope bruennichi TaxID=94029 RepID=UPI002493F51D|nr:proepiregulin-like [Argiope bruennichi]